MLGLLRLGGNFRDRKKPQAKKKKEKEIRRSNRTEVAKVVCHDLWIGWPTELFHTGSIPVPYGIRVGWKNGTFTVLIESVWI